MAKRILKNVMGTSVTDQERDAILKIADEEEKSISQAIRDLIRAQLKANDPDYDGTTLVLNPGFTKDQGQDVVDYCEKKGLEKIIKSDGQHVGYEDEAIIEEVK